jgi:hypothetical protein
MLQYREYLKRYAMGKMDKIKEDVGAIKSYLGFIVAQKN